jgi:hypothetical protein
LEKSRVLQEQLFDSGAYEDIAKQVIENAKADKGSFDHKLLATQIFTPENFR